MIKSINDKREIILSRRNKYIDHYNNLIVNILGFEVTLNDDPFMKDIGLTIFCTKCNKRCKNCHNHESWDEKNGQPFTVKEIKTKILNASDLIKHVVFCGGEFTLYPKQLSELLIWSNIQGLRTILYTGETYNNLITTHKLFSDIIIDGEYIDEMKTNKFPSSKNQNVYVNGKLLEHHEIYNLIINNMGGNK